MLWKERLNSDGKQFYKYQQNEQPRLISNHWTQKKITSYDIGNSGPGFGQARKYDGVKSVTVMQTLPSWQLDLQWLYRYEQTIKKKLAH
jgi:hypothetical protein